MPNLNKINIARRTILVGLASCALAGPVFALNKRTASILVDQLVREINVAIDSGMSEAKLIGRFERIFADYADVNIIARSALGPAARSAKPAELEAYIASFRGYIARKYGKQFQKFIGGKIEVTGTTDRGKFFEVMTVTELRGSAPFDVAFRVSDRSGRNLFFDIIIEGISLLSSERVEIGALLDARNGDIAKLTRDLARLG
ncbi:ABC transporter substrate-binding protein [Planktomarina temperata]|nr:ABC transporter substrate-binding protein [Planktomarina temperata]